MSATPPDPRPTVAISVDGRRVAARAGDPVAAALPDARLFCNMGTCCECMVTIAGRRVRACLTPVSEGLAVTTHG